MNRIIAALDLQEQTSLVVNKAAEMAQKFDAELHLVHVVAPMGTYATTNIVDPLAGIDTALLPTELDIVETHKEVATQELAKLAEPLQGLPTIQRVLMGSVEDEISNYAQEAAATMIVVGSHHRSGLSRLLNGETSVRILHEAQIPILVVPTIVKNK